METLDGPGIVVERAMYDSRRGVTFEAGHESAGVTAPSTRWYFAEGATGPYFDLFLLIANPGDQAADVRVTYLLPDGTRERRVHHVGPWQRYTIWVDKEGGTLADTAVSAIVESVNDVPIVVERSMWWPGDSRTWTEAHNSPGATQPGTRWAVADGEVSTGAAATATYLLVANTSEQEARVRVTLLFRPGVPAVSREFTVAGQQPVRRERRRCVPGSRGGALRRARREPRRHARSRSSSSARCTPMRPDNPGPAARTSSRRASSERARAAPSCHAWCCPPTL